MVGRETVKTQNQYTGDHRMKLGTVRRKVKVYAGKSARQITLGAPQGGMFLGNANVKQRLAKLLRLKQKGLVPEPTPPDLTIGATPQAWHDKSTPKPFANLEYYLATKPPDLPPLKETAVVLKRRAQQ